MGTTGCTARKGADYNDEGSVSEFGHESSSSFHPSRTACCGAPPGEKYSATRFNSLDAPIQPTLSMLASSELLDNPQQESAERRGSLKKWKATKLAGGSGSKGRTVSAGDASVPSREPLSQAAKAQRMERRKKREQLREARARSQRASSHRSSSSTQPKVNATTSSSTLAALAASNPSYLHRKRLPENYPQHQRRKTDLPPEEDLGKTKPPRQRRRKSTNLDQNVKRPPSVTTSTNLDQNVKRPLTVASSTSPPNVSKNSPKEKHQKKKGGASPQLTRPSSVPLPPPALTLAHSHARSPSAQDSSSKPPSSSKSSSISPSPTPPLSSSSSTASSSVLSLPSSRSPSPSPSPSPSLSDSSLSSLPLSASTSSASSSHSVPSLSDSSPSSVDSDSAEIQTIPARFLTAAGGDEQKALAHWKATQAFRKSYKLDEILTQPHQHFRTVKNILPHFYHKRTRQGHCVYYEAPGLIDLKSLEKLHLGVDDLFWHYLYLSEFLWREIETSESAKVLTVIDLKGVSVADIASNGKVLEYIRRVGDCSRDHYPDRSLLIFMINVPNWFSFVWKHVISPLLDAKTKSRTFIYGKDYLQPLMEHIALEDIPEVYGGKCRCQGGDCRSLSDIEIALSQHVEKFLKEPCASHSISSASASSSQRQV